MILAGRVSVWNTPAEGALLLFCDKAKPDGSWLRAVPITFTRLARSQRSASARWSDDPSGFTRINGASRQKHLTHLGDSA